MSYGTYIYRPATVQDLAQVLRSEYGPWESRIGYERNTWVKYRAGP